MRFLLLLLIALMLVSNGFAQPDGLGAFRGQLTNPGGFACSVTIQKETSGELTCTLLSGNQVIAAQTVPATDSSIITWEFDHGLRFRGRVREGVFSYGFMQSGIMQHHIPLSQKGTDWVGEWLPWYVHTLNPATIYLGVEGDDGGDRQLYPFFDDPRFPGTGAGMFQEVDPNVWTFQDFFTGMQFRASWQRDHYELEIRLGKALLSKARLTAYEGNFPNPVRPARRETTYQKPRKTDAWPVQKARSAGFDPDRLTTMTLQVDTGAYLDTDAILIARSGKLIYEAYFGGFDRGMIHQLRSAQKSLAGTLAGLAIRDGYLPGVDATLAEYLPALRKPLLKDDPRKATITLHDLLTMRSGLDAIDFGIDRQSPAAEHNYQSTPDWTATILQAPMIHEPGTKAWYGTANPHLVGDMLRQAIPQPLPFYQHEQLFAPLGITNYALQNNLRGEYYTGGGMHLRPLDMLTYGQWYLQEGTWIGQPLLPDGFVQKTFTAYGPLQNANDKNQYGFLWWQHHYPLGNDTVTTWEARGAGGQYLIVVPELDMVVAITSSNYRNGGFNLPEAILRDHILPAIIRK